jgi:hypothetical protein
MRDRGYSYASPIAANDDERWESDTPSGLELATATADVACKQSTNLVSIWSGVEASAQRAAIAAHPREFEALLAAKRHELANARALIASNG